MLEAIMGGARWKTPEQYQMRRINTLKNAKGEITGYRPMIQQGRGRDRRTQSEVFPITERVDAGMALSMAQRWRDKTEIVLGIHGGQISAKSAGRFLPGISLVVSTKAPFRAYWKWQRSGHKKITVYLGAKQSYSSGYEALIVRICDHLQLPYPEPSALPLPSSAQHERLRAMNIAGLPGLESSLDRSIGA